MTNCMPRWRNVPTTLSGIARSLRWGGFLILLGLMPLRSDAQSTNNAYTNATVLMGEMGTVTGNITGATLEEDEPEHWPFNFPGSNSIWFRWTAPTTGAYTFDTIGTSTDTILAIY